MKKLKMMFAIAFIAAASVGASIFSNKAIQEKSLAREQALLFGEEVEALSSAENLTFSESIVIKSSSDIPQSNYNGNGPGWGYQRKYFEVVVAEYSDSTSVYSTNNSNSQEMAASIVIKQNIGVERGKANKTATCKKKTALQSYCEWTGNKLIKCN